MTMMIARANELVQVPGQDGITAFRRIFHAKLDVFEGHYPGFPIVPGVLLVESCAAAVQFLPETTGQWAGVHSTRFLAPVRPDDEATVFVTSKRRAGQSTHYKCKLAVNGEQACAVTLVFAPSLAAAAEEAPYPEETSGGSCLRDIKGILPHRTPILLVDRVDRLFPGRSITARKAVSANELFHRSLPTTAGFPWSLMIESWCQSAGILVAADDPNPDVLIGDVMLFGGMRGIDFHRSAHPGDVLVHHAVLERSVDGTAVMSGRTLIDGETAMTIGSISLARRPASNLTGQ
jgi:3-hydroxyacyl-[acyl-carrier-protein] dehydratase